MKKYLCVLIVITLLIVTACNNKPEKIVDNFLEQVNDEIDNNLDSSIFTSSLYNIINTHGIYLSKDGWKLSTYKKTIP